MNAFQILEQIMEAIADGRKPSETTAQFRDRKADELQQHFDDKARVAQQEERVAHKQAIKAKKEYEQNPSSETGQNMANTAIKALDKSMATTSAERKADKIKQIKGKIDWRKSMSEALDIMEEILNVVDEDIHSAIDKKYPKESGKNKELHDTVSVAKIDAEEVAKEHELGKRPESAPITDLFNIPAETPEEREYAKKESKWNVRNIKKEFTNNKIGDNKTRSKQFPKSYKDVGVLGEPDAKELETERAARKALGKRKAKMNKNEALSLIEQICDFADNLFELDYEEKQNISPNKITKVKKDKNGEKVEVVSVADELFPYSGSAKEQFNKKVLDKINDMIEGTGSLEDLIQFVRKGVATKKAVHEGKEPNKECEYRKTKWEEATQKYFDTKKKNMDFEGKHPETKKAYDEERKAYANLDKARRDSKKINGPYEALEEIKNVAEGLFKKDERGDLLDDIDTALGSPVKKKLKDIKAKMTGCKETKVHEALDLMEEVISEVSDRVYRIGKNKAADIGNAQEEAAKTAEGEDKEWTKDQVAKRSHQAAVLDDKYERQVAKRAEEEYKKSKVDKSSKK